jgi:hypothetical protein
MEGFKRLGRFISRFPFALILVILRRGKRFP